MSTGGDYIEEMEPDWTSRLDQLKEFNRCEVCERVMCRPVFFPACGHTPMCQQCAVVKKPKNCPRCGQSNKTPSARLKVNLALGALLRALWPQDFQGGRPSDDALLYELQRKEAVQRLDAAIARTKIEGAYHANLPPDYYDKALRLIDMQYADDEKQLGTHVLRWCSCDLIELPKKARKTGRAFFGCPAWTPFSKKRKRVSEDGVAETDDTQLEPSDLKHCSDFAHLSAKQRKILFDE